MFNKLLILANIFMTSVLSYATPCGVTAYSLRGWVLDHAEFLEVLFILSLFFFLRVKGL